MNDEPQTQADATLHRLMTTVIGPDALSDVDIESLLNSPEPSMALSDEQTQRIVGKVTRLLNAAAKTSARGSGPMLPVDQRPRLVSATTHEPPRPIRIPAVVALLASMLALVSVIVLMPETPSQSRTAAHLPESPGFSGRPASHYWMTAKPSPDAVPATKVAVGDEIATGDLERRRVTLPDGSVLYVNSGSQVKIATERRVEVTRGEVFVEVVPAFDRASHGTQSSRHSLSDEAAAPATTEIVTQRVTATLPFEIVTPNRTVTALGTKFSVSVDDSETDVMVTQGKVKVSGVDEVVAAGQQVKASNEYTFASAPQASAALEWTRDLLAAATGPLVPKSEFSGGALVTVDPNGQSSKLSLRNYHIDVHIEDGFARTTIDQTYFNHTHSRLEGTFHFPLPTDASLSRLAMYVNGKLMEGGMAERDHARNTFEEIKRKMLDPALLEWVDGSTFKMRVFPLEPRQEKRIVLSYSQRLNSAEGQLSYRFPAGHTMDAVRDWSAHVRIKGGAGAEWHSQSHTMTAMEDAGDLVLDAGLKNASMDRDFVLKVADNSNLKSQISNFKSEGQQYLMLRLRPDLPGEMQRQPHHWIFLFEHAGDRSPLLARAQIEILRTLLENAEHSDTFSIVSASTRAELYPAERQLCTAENTAAAIKHLDNIHLVGALDLAAAFRKCAEEIALPHLMDNGLVPRSKILIHLGSGLPALGERDASKLAAMIPAEAQYVGIGVGRRWNQAMMKLAASRTGGLSTQINPDEEIAWRAFDVFSKLHSPRLVDLAVKSEDLKSQISNPKSEEDTQFLLFSDTITHGEELGAICRVPEGQPLPTSVTVTATLNGNPWTQTIQVGNVKDQATYLPRHWAKLEIDRLLADNAEQHREAIVALSKSMYVMSPFTSLLVLENEEMYTQFNIDRGRKDHWALYPCPEQIEVAVENTDKAAPTEVVTTDLPKTPADVMSTISRIQPPQWFTWNFPQMVLGDGSSRYVVPQWGVEANGRLPQVYPYYSYRGTNDFGLDPGNGSLNHWGRTQQQGNMWFENNATGYWLDSDNDGDGIQEGIWNESLTPPRVFFDMNLHDNADWRFRRNLGRDESVLFGNRLDEEQLNSDEARYIRDISVQDVNQWGKPADQAGRRLNERMGVDFNVQDTRLITELFEDRLSFQTQDPGRPALAMPLPRRASGLWSDRARVSSVPTDRPLDHVFWKVRSWESEFSDPSLNLRDDVSVQQMQDLGLGSFIPQGSVCTVRMTATPLVIMLRAGDRIDLLISDGNSLSSPNSVGGSSVLQSLEVFATVNQIELHGNRRTKSISFLVDQTQGKILNAAQMNGTISVYGDHTNMENRIEFPTLQQHRWSTSTLAFDTGFVTLPTFQPPSPHAFGLNEILFGDLISHAPGLNTSSADVLAVVEKESGKRRAESRDGQSAISNLKSQISNPPAGRVDVAARALIEKSRSRGWESITLPGREGEAGITVHYDGQGRHVWERVVSEGMREHVVCDGSTLWHVYREIGLASKRPFSRFHHRDLTAIVPWLLPSADELARGADVVAVDERTVAIVPVSGTALAAGEDKSRGPESGKPIAGNSDFKSEISDSEGKNQTPAASAVPLMIHLVFAPDGRLAERLIVEQASGKIMHRVTYDADGTVRIVDRHGKELSSLNLHRSTSAAPQLAPNLNGLVVLPMPMRTSDVIIAKATVTAAKETADLGQVGVLDSDLSEDDAVSLMLAYMANGNGARMVEIARKRFIDKGDTRDGIYVLLSRFPQALVQAAIPADATPGSVQTPGYDLRPPVEGSPLKQFVRQYMNWLRDGDAANEFRIDAPEGSFLQRMATARNLYVRWLTDAATKDLTQAQVQQEVDRTLEFIESCRTLDMGWSLMSVMRPRLNTPEFLATYSKAAERFEQHPQIGLLVRRERMTALFAADKHEEGRSLFKDWLLAHLEQGFVPPIGTELYHACISNNGQQQIDELLLESAKQLVNAQMLMTLHSMSVQMRELGNTHIADQMMTLLLASLDAKERPDVSLYAIEQLRRMKDPRADKLLDQVMELPMADQVPGLWRFASKLAEDSGRKRLAAERLERAIQLEFASRPTVINIQTVRSDYTEILAKYEELITASTTLELAPPADLAARIIQAADQWRTLDEDDTVACQTASRLLSKLNSKELAWDYLTTPLAEKSGESAPWIALARSLGTDTQTDLADMAWTQAFEQESTNPEILLEHARLLQTAGRIAPAKVLLKLAVDGTWQPRFAGAVQQCRDLLNSL